MITYTRPIADNLPIKTLVARRLQTKSITLNNLYALSLIYCMTVPIRLCPIFVFTYKIMPTNTHTRIHTYTRAHNSGYAHVHCKVYDGVRLLWVLLCCPPSSTNPPCPFDVEVQSLSQP